MKEENTPLEKIMRIVENQGINKKDFLKNIQEKYRDYVREGLFDLLKELEKITGIKPKVSEDVVQEAYVHCIKERQFSDIEVLEKITGIKPKVSEDVVQKGYWSLLTNSDHLKYSNHSRILEEATGIKISEDTVQEVYERSVSIERRWAFPEERDEKIVLIHDLERLEEITGIKPKVSEDTIKEAYETYIRKQMFSQMKKLKEVTGIKPKISEDTIQELYEGCVRKERILDIGALEEATGIKPSKDFVQEAYKSLFQTARHYFLSKWRTLKEITGIKPSEDAVQEAYEYLLADWSFDKLKELEEITGIKISEDAVQEAYAYHIRKDTYTSAFKRLKEATGIKPKISEDAVQEAYISFVRSGQVDAFKELKKITGIKPSEDFYKSLIKSLMEEIEDKN